MIVRNKATKITGIYTTPPAKKITESAPVPECRSRRNAFFGN